MNPKGVELFSESTILSDSIGGYPSRARVLNFCKPCYMFIKEKDKEKAYFAIKLNTNFIETID